MAKQKKIEPLVGEDLLKKVKELESLSKEEKAKQSFEDALKILEELISHILASY